MITSALMLSVLLLTMLAVYGSFARATQVRVQPVGR